MSLMFDRILNATLSEEKVSTTRFTQGNLIISELFETFALFFKADLFIIVFLKFLVIKDL